jgi:hypothetical protein
VRIIKKLLESFKLKSTREIEDTINIFSSDTQNRQNLEDEIETKNVEKNKLKKSYMSKYEVERYAIMCNAYTIKEERKKKEDLT